MTQYFSIPLKPEAQTFKTTLSGVDYWLTLTYIDVEEGGWILTIADASQNPIIAGIPLVTGANLLAQYESFGLPGRLWVQTTFNPDAVPTYQNLGSESFLYWVTD